MARGRPPRVVDPPNPPFRGWFSHEEDIVKEVEYWQTTLVGTVLGKQSTLVQIESLVFKYWTHITTPEIMYFAKGWYYFRFASAEDMNKIRSDTWNVNGFPLVFKPWSPTIIDELNVSHVPVPRWVASAIGNPICANEHTTNKSKLAFARVLVDVDLSKELPKAIKINSPYRGPLLQAVAYEWVPHFCTACKKIGHTQDRCKPAGPAKPKAVYRPKQPAAPKPPEASRSPKPTGTPKQPIVQKTVATKLSNRFSMLQEGGLIEPGSSVLVNVETESEGDKSVDDVVSEDFELDPGEVDCGAFIETHVKHTTIKDVRRIFTGYDLVHNSACHYNGRIWVVWKPTLISLSVLHQSAQHIHCSLLHIATQKCIEVTFVYAFNARLDRRILWDHLQGISHQVSVPWLCMGDFNVVLNMDERLGSTHVQMADMHEFSACLDVCQLVDHHTTGCHFTWNNKQGDGLRWAKLDRILASPQWLSRVSDHSPCLVNIADLPHPPRASFKYLNCWALSPHFQDHVREGWGTQYSANHIVSLFLKLKNLRRTLKKLHTTSFTSLSDRVKKSKVALEQCQDDLRNSPMDPTLISLEKKLLHGYLLVKRAEMQVLFQRAKVQHLQLNDLSTRFFYSKLADRRLRNSIGRIHDEDGNLCTGTEEISAGFISYYKHLLGSSSPVTSLPSHLFHQDTLPHDVGNPCSAQIRVPEILDALKSIDRNKSPGIDGYSSVSFWMLGMWLGPILKSAVLEFFQDLLSS
ncbi:uncharacterized protein LOC141600940 [Silene latifolia]|uniref:uncharacterized protein LOC141600940 n=1 Tax=Silene latifolia TaxID=37657 RepID=UPI003D772363